MLCMLRSVSSARREKDRQRRKRKRGTPAVSSLAFTTGETIVRRDNQVVNLWRQPAARRISGVVELVCQGSACSYTRGLIYIRLLQ